jgi:hypothetical protein
MGGSHQVSTTAKQIVDRTMGGEKPLGLSWRFEASHLALSLLRELMGDLGSIIQTSVLMMGDTRQHLSARGSVAAQLICDEEHSATPSTTYERNAWRRAGLGAFVPGYPARSRPDLRPATDSAASPGW